MLHPLLPTWDRMEAFSGVSNGWRGWLAEEGIKLK